MYLLYILAFENNERLHRSYRLLPRYRRDDHSWMEKPWNLDDLTRRCQRMTAEKRVQQLARMAVPKFALRRFYPRWKGNRKANSGKGIVRICPAEKGEEAETGIASVEPIFAFLAWVERRVVA